MESDSSSVSVASSVSEALLLVVRERDFSGGAGMREHWIAQSLHTVACVWTPVILNTIVGTLVDTLIQTHPSV